MNFTYNFPATRGIQAEKEFFSIICPLGYLQKIFTFYNDEIPAKYRAQRTLNDKRIPEIKDYILDNPTNYIFSSITASIDGEYTFQPIAETNEKIGTLHISMDANLLINDGQHRKAAIDEAIKEKPSLKDEDISVVLFIDQGLEQSQQMFSDLNLHAMKVSKSLGILYDHRDPKIQFLNNFIESNSKYNNFIDNSNPSVASKSNKLFTLANFKTAFEKSYGNEDIINNEQLQKFVIDYWDYLSNNFAEWKFVFEKKTHASDARKDSVAVYGVVLESLGKLGYYFYSNEISAWKSKVKRLNSIDWNKSNRQDWMHRCLHESGKMQKSSTAVNRTYIRIKELIDLPLSSTEEKLEESLRKEH